MTGSFAPLRNENADGLKTFLNSNHNTAARRQIMDWFPRRLYPGEMLNIIGLQGVKKCYPVQLCRGQQQRVALAHALVFNPHILLMDEAVGALDVKSREHMQTEIRRIHDSRLAHAQMLASAW